MELAFDTARFPDPTAAGLAFASADELTNPLVSPVYAEFDESFPPVLIQGGTREVMLSGFVRLYRAIDSAGGIAKLDLYEGMFHAFQEIAWFLPESTQSRQNTIRFLEKHLR